MSYILAQDTRMYAKLNKIKFVQRFDRDRAGFIPACDSDNRTMFVLNI